MPLQLKMRLSFYLQGVLDVSNKTFFVSMGFILSSVLASFYRPLQTVTEKDWSDI